MSVVLYHATLKHYSKPASQDSIHHHEQKEVDIGAAEQQHHQKKVGLKIGGHHLYKLINISSNQSTNWRTSLLIVSDRGILSNT
jgi:hypothetical protein